LPIILKFKLHIATNAMIAHLGCVMTRRCNHSVMLVHAISAWEVYWV